jgi:phosphate transport system protein
MTHYEERLSHDLDQLREGVLGVAAQVEANLRQALHALLQHDKGLAWRTILRDHPVNRDVEANDRRCHHFMARHLPSGGHLRFVSAVLRINIELERLGDYAVNISREVPHLSRPLEGTIRQEIELMSQQALLMLHEALEAFRLQDESRARATMHLAEHIDRTYVVTFEALKAEGIEGHRSVGDLFGLFVVIRMIERVGDQAKNLCEQVVFATTGETKQRRPVRVLFLDATGDRLGPMAVALGQKLFPYSGRFACAAPAAPARLNTALVDFLNTHGYDLEGVQPSTLQEQPLVEYDVLVGLDGPAEGYGLRVPFHTVALAWSLPAGEDLRALHQALGTHIQDLMVTLRGEGAS